MSGERKLMFKPYKFWGMMPSNAKGWAAILIVHAPLFAIAWFTITATLHTDEIFTKMDLIFWPTAVIYIIADVIWEKLYYDKNYPEYKAFTGKLKNENKEEK